MTTRELLTLPIAKPRFIEPMTLSDCRELPEGQEWAYEAKLDGYRCLEFSVCTTRSENGMDY